MPAVYSQMVQEKKVGVCVCVCVESKEKHGWHNVNNWWTYAKFIWVLLAGLISFNEKSWEKYQMNNTASKTEFMMWFQASKKDVVIASYWLFFILNFKNCIEKKHMLMIKHLNTAL